MNKPSKTFYIWLAVVLLNIVTATFIVSNQIQRSGPLLSNLFQSEYFIALGASIFVSAVPVIIARSNSNLKNHILRGLAVLFLLSILYLIYNFFTCTGEYCQVGGIILIPIFMLMAGVFYIFYIAGVRSKK